MREQEWCARRNARRGSGRGRSGEPRGRREGNRGGREGDTRNVARG